MHGNISFEKNEWKVAEDETIIVDPEARKERQEKHNWKATGIAVCAITFIMVAVTIAALVMETEDENEAYWQKFPYDLHAALDEDESSIFVGRDGSPSGQQWRSTRWIKDRQLVYWDEFGGLSVYEADTNRSAILVPSAIVLEWRAEDYWPSYDGRYVLLRQRPLDSSGPAVAGERHEAFYAVYDTRDNDLWKVRLKHDQLLPAGFAFAGWMGATSHLVVVKDNVIYWTKDATCRSQWQLRSRYVNTKDYYVGLPDWTYAEGVARWKSLMWPSLAGDSLLYAVLDVSRCHRLDYVDYLSDRAEARSLHYAVAGGRLPEIQLRLLHMENGTEIPLQLGQLANLREWFLIQVEWLDKNSFLTAWMTRNQNSTSIFRCLTNTVTCFEIALVEAPENQWLSPPQIFASSSSQLVGEGGFLMASETGDGQSTSGVTRLTIYRPPWQKTVIIPLDGLDVRRIVGWDESNKTIYILGNPKSEPQQRHLYRIRPHARERIECLTCDPSVNNCGFVDVRFEPEMAAYYELQCLGPHIPDSWIVRAEDGEQLVSLRQLDPEGEDDEKTRDLWEHLTPLVQYLDVPLADGKSSGRAQLLLPRTWTADAYHTLRFPLIVQTLDWDEDEAMTDQWRKDWATYFTVTRQVVYARISGRERITNGYGALRLGAEDVLTVINFLVNNVRHVDGQAVVLMGKGVGGYLAITAMAQDELNVVKCGVLTTPTVDWLTQETTVAERYLGHYKDKQEHYVLSRIEGYIPHFRNGSLLVMDTFYYNPVQHFQLIRLNQHLVKAGTLFQQQIYPRAAKRTTQYHYYLSVELFVTHCLHGTD